MELNPLEIPVYLQQYLVESQKYNYFPGYAYWFKFENGREVSVSIYKGSAGYGKNQFETLEIIGSSEFGKRRGYMTNPDVIKELERVRKMEVSEDVAGSKLSCSK